MEVQRCHRFASLKTNDSGFGQRSAWDPKSWQVPNNNHFAVPGLPGVLADWNEKCRQTESAHALKVCARFPGGKFRR
jgi:hypothetical protein